MFLLQGTYYQYAKNQYDQYITSHASCVVAQGNQ